MTRLACTTAASLIAAAGLLATQHAGAQELQYEAFEQLFGEAVTTSVTGSPQRQSTVPATMEIITAEQIRRSGARDIPGVLQRVGGVNVMQWAHDHADVAIRGYNQTFSPRLLVLVDGRQVYADHYGYTPWPTLPIELDAIHQIEIVKGPSTALFGFNAVDGVVNIVTINPLHQSKRTTTVAAGTQDVRAGTSVMTFDLGDSGAALLSAGTSRSDDFSTSTRQPGPSDLPRGSSRDAITLDTRFAVRDKVEIGFDVSYSDAEYVELAPTYTLSYGAYEVGSVKGRFSADTGIGLLQGTLYRNSINGHIETYVGGPIRLRIDNGVSVAKLQDVLKIGTDHVVRVSAEYRENGSDTGTVEGGRVYYDVAAVGGMWSWAVTPALSLTNAIRYDRLSLGRRGTTPPGYGLENEDWDRTLTERSFNTGLVWQLGETDTLRFISGRGVQLPSLFNLGGSLFPVAPFAYVSGVPFMQPSVTTNYEVAWDRALASIHGRLRASVFRGTTRRAISFVGGALPELRLLITPINMGDSRTHGLELSLSGSTGERWTWEASYQHQEIDDDFTPGLEATLVDYENTMPEHVLKGSVGWQRGRWQVDANVRYQSRTHGIRGLGAGTLGATLVPISDYVAVDGRLAYAVTERATLELSARDLAHPEQVQTSAAAVERRLLARLALSF